MKIYDMIEGVWLKEKTKKEKRKIRDCKVFEIATRIVTYDEENERAVEKEKNYTESRKDLDS